MVNRKLNRIMCSTAILAIMANSLAACDKGGNSSVAYNMETTTQRETMDTVNPDASEPNQSVARDALITETTLGTSETEETTETTVITETSETTPAPTPTPKPGKVKITDAFKKTYKVDGGKLTVHLPKVTIEGVDTTKVNKQILKLKKEVKGQECKYKYYVGKTYVSILLYGIYDPYHDAKYYYVFNVSRITGQKMSRAEMLKAVGVKNSSFNTRVKKAVKKWWKQYNLDKDDPVDYKKAISKKTLSKAIPFMNSKGKLSYLIKDMDMPVEGGCYDDCGTC